MLIAYLASLTKGLDTANDVSVVREEGGEGTRREEGGEGIRREEGGGGIRRGGGGRRG